MPILTIYSTSYPIHQEFPRKICQNRKISVDIFKFMIKCFQLFPIGTGLDPDRIGPRPEGRENYVPSE